MAIAVLPDIPSEGGMSPRISFSHDLSQNDAVPVARNIRSSSSSSSADFDFCVSGESLDRDQLSSADELFSDGIILPVEIKKRLAPPPPRPPPPPHQIPKNMKIRGPISGTEEKQNNKSPFWRFKRSSSLNGGNNYARTLCPLPPLPRSNTTGSTSSAKRSSLSNKQKKSSPKYSSSNSSLKQSPSMPHQNPPLKKSSHGFYSNGVRISPVLKVPPATLFGLCFIFSGTGKDRSNKK